MSGGKEKKSRSNKAQGWEEAGAEFYQESYPADWENFQRDPAAIATLLPSKQNRAATTRRVRSANHQDTKGTRGRRQQTTTTHNRRRNSTANRRGSQYHEAQAAMLPDLSQDLTDEERIWEEIHEIKTMPVSMAQKKEMKAQLQNATKLRLQGFDQFKWQKRKMWQQFLIKWNELLTKIDLWRNSLNKIEGNFGTGVVAYFLFLRWLMFLNLCIFGLIFIFIVMPQLIFIEPKDKPCDRSINYDHDYTTTVIQNSTECCAELYFNNTISEISIIDIIQGTGFMEKTLMFYGMYTNKIYGYFPYGWNEIDNDDNDGIEKLRRTTESDNNNGNNNKDFILKKSEIINSSQEFNHQQNNDELYYDLPLAYVSVTAVYLFISLAAIVKSASREFKDRLVDGEGQFYQYCNLIFGGWDFCIHNEKSADIKHKALYIEIKGLLQSKRMEYERHNRSKDYMFRLIVIRFIINFLVLLILAISALFIYLLFNVSLKYLEPNFRQTQQQHHAILNDNTNNYDINNAAEDLMMSSSVRFLNRNSTRIITNGHVKFSNNRSHANYANIEQKSRYQIPAVSSADDMGKNFNENLTLNSNNDNNLKLLYDDLAGAEENTNNLQKQRISVGKDDKNYVTINSNSLNDDITENNAYHHKIIQIIRNQTSTITPLSTTTISSNQEAIQENSNQNSNSSFYEDTENYVNNQQNQIKSAALTTEDTRNTIDSIRRFDVVNFTENYSNNPPQRQIFADLDDVQIVSSSPQQHEGDELLQQLVILFYEFLPYLAIVGLNIIIPILFNYLVQFEQYSPMFVIKITLLRTVFLRLSSLLVLLSRFYFLIIPKNDDECYYFSNKNTSNNNSKSTTSTSSTTSYFFQSSFNKPHCWETFIGQQFYKLLITDFVTHLFVTFFINFPRSILARNLQTKFARFIGEQEFELSKHVLDIVYLQTVCWLGSFYAPFLPAIASIFLFFMFYIKKFACLVNSKPSPILYRASKSKSLFMFILLLSFCIAIIPIVYAIAELIPSKSCGPFRGLNSVWDSAIIAFMKLPQFIQNCIFFLGTAGFAIPCFIILTLFLYYYYAVSVANKHMVIVLKNQLVLEGHDKQFLLNRLSSFIKQHQEYQKKFRRCDDREQRNRDRERDRAMERNDRGCEERDRGDRNVVEKERNERDRERNKHEGNE